MRNEGYNVSMADAITRGRVLALDFGQRRIGLAVSDPLGLTAQGLPTLERKNKRSDFGALRKLADEYEAAVLLVGHPLNMSGAAGPQAQNAQEFARELERQTGRNVVLWDERLTTREAQRVLVESGVSQKKRSAAIDRLSAVLLLQSYLDQKSVTSDK